MRLLFRGSLRAEGTDSRQKHNMFDLNTKCKDEKLTVPQLVKKFPAFC